MEFFTLLGRPEVRKTPVGKQDKIKGDSDQVLRLDINGRVPVIFSRRALGACVRRMRAVSFWLRGS